MLKWWKNSKSKIISSNEWDNKKKYRSLLSILSDRKQQYDKNLDRKMAEDGLELNRTNSLIDIHRSQQKTQLAHSLERSTVSNQRKTMPSNDFYPSLDNSNSKIEHNKNLDSHSYRYLTEIINENNSCFGFSVSHIKSKYCLYLLSMSFLTIVLIISLIVIFKK